MAEAPTIDLILRGRIAQQPVTLAGTLEDGKLSQISGRITADKSLEEFLQSLGEDFDEVREMLHDWIPDSGIKLGSLAFGYRSSGPKFAQIAITFTADRSGCRFVCLKQLKENGWYVAGLELRLDRELFKNSWLSGLIGEISLSDLAIYYASADVEQVAYDPDQGFQAAEAIPTKAPQEQRRNFTRGLNWTALVSIGDKELLRWPGEKEDKGENKGKIPSTDTSKSDAVGPRASPPKPKNSTTWIELDKSLGPLTVLRIGLAYQAPKVVVKFDASLQLSVLTLTLDGLGMSYPLNKFGLLFKEPKKLFEHLELSLDGMGLALGNGPIEIGGSLLRVRDEDRLEFEGTLLIRTAAFSFSAIGSYADLNGMPSVMAFGVLLMELGDPTGTGGFVVTGLAFGFGVHRKLTLPPIEEVHKFPLVQAAMGKQEFGNIRKLPEQLRPYVLPAVGNFWVAAGIKFNSWAMVDSFLLLSVSWGAEIEIGLLGLSRMTVPPLQPDPEKTIAGVELALRGVIRIAEGSIQFEARLTENSFIFSKACRLTGGFAFCLWFKEPHAGDFVISLGGYHPAFQRPAHYPLVPRLGMQLQIGNELSITGEAYFALTPSCIMAGGKLCAVFKSGGIEAWFIAYADFLMSWQPFYYQATMGITIGIALRLGLIAIRLELSVDLRLQGPPFGGEARVQLWVISFTIPFGTPASAPPPLTASDFVKKCLPAPRIRSGDAARPQGVDQALPASPDVFTVRITTGLLREQEIKGENRTHRIVNAHQLSLVVQSVIPCTKFAGLAEKVDAAAPCGIRPMGRTSLESVFTVTADGIEPGKHVKVSAITGNVPDAVWGNEGLVLLPKTPDRKTVKATLGIRIVCIPQVPVAELPAIPIKEFDFDLIEKTVDWGEPGKLPKYKLSEEGATIFNTICSDSVNESRKAILACLRRQLPADLLLNEPDLKRLSNDKDYFQARPEMTAVGY